MLRVGLTGGIASGKTRVRARLAEAGLPTFDLDHVAHAVVEPGRPAHAEIVRLFGPTVLAPDGRVDRRVLGGIVFADPAAREDLNAIVHPRVFEEHDRLVEGLPPGTKVVVTDATLLVESGYHIRFDRLVVTSCRVDQQIERLTARDGLSEADARSRIAAQMPAAEKVSFAHRVVDTSVTEEETDRSAHALAGELSALAESGTGPARLDLARVVGCLARGPVRGPRGLSPLRLARSIGERGAPCFPILARELRPPWIGPWYEAGRTEAAEDGPETLMGPLALWSRAWHGADVESLVAAAVSTARLTHVLPEALAAAAAMALAVSEVADAGAVPRDLAARVRTRDSLVARWAGEASPRALLERLDQAPLDSAGGVAGALHGLAAGVDPGRAPSDVVSAAQALVLAFTRRLR